MKNQNLITRKGYEDQHSILFNKSRCVLFMSSRFFKWVQTLGESNMLPLTLDTSSAETVQQFNCIY